MKLRAREFAALITLDRLCWENSERGGDGRVKISGFAQEHGVVYNYASQLLLDLEALGAVESVRALSHHKYYSLTKAGAAYLRGANEEKGGEDGR